MRKRLKVNYSTKYKKILKPKTKKFEFEELHENPSIGYDAFLNTKTWNSDISRDILDSIKTETILKQPSKFDIDYYSGKIEIELSPSAWKKMQEADDEEININAIKAFQNRVKKFYE